MIEPLRVAIPDRCGFAAFVAVILVAIGACTAPPPTIGPEPTISGIVTAGCPRLPSPQPSACAPRPVAGALIVATEANGSEVGTLTAANGTYVIGIGVTGTVVIKGLPSSGVFAGPPDPVTVTIGPGMGLTVNFVYDLGVHLGPS